MANTVPIHDFSNVTELNEEQKRQLSELERAQGVASDAGYRIVAPQPTAKLLSGYTIPLVGLGTWCVGLGETQGECRRRRTRNVTRTGQRHTQSRPMAAKHVTQHLRSFHAVFAWCV